MSEREYTPPHAMLYGKLTDLITKYDRIQLVQTTTARIGQNPGGTPGLGADPATAKAVREICHSQLVIWEKEAEEILARELVRRKTAREEAANKLLETLPPE